MNPSLHLFLLLTLALLPFSLQINVKFRDLEPSALWNEFLQLCDTGEDAANYQKLFTCFDPEDEDYSQRVQDTIKTVLCSQYTLTYPVICYEFPELEAASLSQLMTLQLLVKETLLGSEAKLSVDDFKVILGGTYRSVNESLVEKFVKRISSMALTLKLYRLRSKDSSLQTKEAILRELNQMYEAMLNETKMLLLEKEHITFDEFMAVLRQKIEHQVSSQLKMNPQQRRSDRSRTLSTESTASIASTLSNDSNQSTESTSTNSIKTDESSTRTSLKAKPTPVVRIRHVPESHLSVSLKRDIITKKLRDVAFWQNIYYACLMVAVVLAFFAYNRLMKGKEGDSDFV